MFKESLWDHRIIKKWLIVGVVLMLVGEFFGHWIPFLG